MHPNCPSYQEGRFIIMEPKLDSNRKTSKKQNSKRNLLDSIKRQKPSLRLQPCEIANISPRAEICNIAWLESVDSVLAEQVPVQRSRAESRNVRRGVTREGHEGHAHPPQKKKNFDFSLQRECGEIIASQRRLLIAGLEDPKIAFASCFN